MTARIYVEGGGDSKELHARCREGYRRLFERAGFAGRMPRLVACGGRQTTFDDFRVAHDRRAGAFVAMLVDSEDPVSDGEQPWDHLQRRDGWRRPPRAEDDQTLLMVTCMESWIACDRDAIDQHFGSGVQTSALPDITALEGRDRNDVLRALQHATRRCRAPYAKGKVAFAVLGRLSPDVLKARLPAFARIVRILDARL